MNERIETIAEKVLTEAGQKGKLPVNPTNVAKYLGLRVSLEDFSDDLSGVLIRKANTQPTIAVNKSNSETRRRFSIAHELGHYVLEHRGEIFVDNIIMNKRDVRSSWAIDTNEIEANSFAAALLMPRELIFTLAVSMLGKKGVPSQSSLTQKLAKKFRVSNQAMGYRLINLGIVTTIGEEE